MLWLWLRGRGGGDILREDFIFVIKFSVQSEKLHNMFDICLYGMQMR